MGSWAQGHKAKIHRHFLDSKEAPSSAPPPLTAPQGARSPQGPVPFTHSVGEAFAFSLPHETSVMLYWVRKPGAIGLVCRLQMAMETVTAGVWPSQGALWLRGGAMERGAGRKVWRAQQRRWRAFQAIDLVDDIGDGECM